MSRNKQPKRHTGLIIFLSLIMILLIAGTAFMIKLCIDLTNADVALRPSDSASLLSPEQDSQPTEDTVPTTEAPPETTRPVPDHVVSTATVGAMGDLLMHMPIFSSQYRAACDNGDGTYNFESVFRYLNEYCIITSPELGRGAL